MWKEFIEGFSGSWATTLRIIGRLVRYRPAPWPSSRSETLEEFEEPIRGAIASGTGIEGSGPRQRLLLQSQVGFQVDLCRLGRLVAEPECNDGNALWRAGA